MPVPAAQRPKTRSFRFLRSFSALVLREMATTYGRSPGGYAWAILEPVAGLVLMSVVFSFILRSPPLGDNFMYFFAGGLLPFMLYGSTSAKIAASIRFSKALLEYPAVSFMDAMLARFALNAMTLVLVMALIFGGLIIFYDMSPILRWPSIFLSLAMALAIGIGVGSVNCFLSTSYPLWEHVWAVLNRPMFILSGIFFIPESVPEQFRGYLMLNPLVHVTSEMRKGLFPTYDAVYVDPVYVFIVSVTLSIFGLLFLLRYHKEIVLK